MKKIKILSVLMSLMAMGLAGCGNNGGEKDATYGSDASGHWTVAEDGTKGEKAKHDLKEDASKGKAATCKEAGEKVEVCSVCGYEKKTTLSKLSHEFVEDAAASTTSTCSVPGKKVEKCKNCTEKKETDLPLAAHTLSGAGTAKTDDNGREYTEYTCSTCHGVVSTRIAFNTFTVTAGEFKDGKISQDPVGEIAWNVQLPAGDYDVYFEAKFSSSSGADRTFETRKVNLNYNGVDVEYDKTKTAEDVGMNSSDFVAFTFCSITATGNVDTMKLQNPNYRLVFDTEGYIVFKPVATVA